MRTQTTSYYICRLSARIQFLLIILVGCCIVLSEVEKAYTYFSQADIEILDFNKEKGEKESKKDNLKKKDKLEKITSSFLPLSLQYHLALSSNFSLLSYGSEPYLEPPFSPPETLS